MSDWQYQELHSELKRLRARVEKLEAAAKAPPPQPEPKPWTAEWWKRAAEHRR